MSSLPSFMRRESIGLAGESVRKNRVLVFSICGIYFLLRALFEIVLLERLRNYEDVM